MKVLLYFEGEKYISKSGIGRAMKHQIAALTSQGIDYTLDPKDNYDIAHINTIGLQSSRLINYCKKRNIKIIYHAHSTEEDFRNSFILSNQISPIFKKRIVSLYSQADCIVTPTNYSRQVLLSYNKINKPIYVVSNGININEFNYDIDKVSLFRKYFNISENQKTIICVGLFFKRKGIIDFFEVAKKMPEYLFIWFGDTPLYLIPHDIRKLIKNPPKNVILPGYIKGDILKGAYAGANAFFFPSYEETEGIVVLEALASYQQCVIRDIPVYKSWLIDGENCLKGKNNDDFIRIIKQVVESPESSLKQNARETAEKYAIEKIGMELKAIYENVLEK